MKMNLEGKIEKSKEIILEAKRRFKPSQVAIAWTGGKDSTVVLHLIKETFDGKIPFRVMFNDSTLEFPEIYEFIQRLAGEWNLNLLWVKHFPEDLKAYESAKSPEEKTEIMRIAKINAINFAVSKYKIKAYMVGIRWDEQEARSKETYFSPRSSHMRIHPVLHFTLSNIWEYIHSFRVPYVALYDKGYKSLGAAPFTKPVEDPTAPERAGREATKEETMDRLRKLGYW